MDTVEVKQVIITTLSRRGEGVEADPVRIITEIWDMDGNKITEIDHYKETAIPLEKVKQMIGFGMGVIAAKGEVPHDEVTRIVNEAIAKYK